MAGLFIRQGGYGPLLLGTRTGQVPVFDASTETWLPSEFPIITRSSPVYIEDYLPDAGNDIRTAIRNAWLANPLPGTTFIYPPGTYPFVGAALTLADGFYNFMTHIMYGCELVRDMAGVASGQQIFFIRTENGTSHARNITFLGGKFSLLNCLTSRFGYAIGIIGGQNITLDGCEAYCTMDPAATQGGIRWGFAVFGGDQTLDPTAGTNNIIRNIRLTKSQIQGCAGPNSVNGVTVENILVNASQDYGVSVVSSPGGSVRNVSIRNVQIHDASGSGGVFGGSDGAGTAVGADVVENFFIDGVWICGQRSTPNLSFDFSATVIFDGGILTENIIITNVGAKLVPNAGFQTKGVVIASQDDEVSWHGLQVSNIDSGIVTSNDPLAGLFIAGKNLTDVGISNVHIRGPRGVQIQDCDHLTVSNVQTEDGTLTVIAATRNLDALAFSNCCLKRTSGFNNAIFFQSSTGRNMTKVMLSNMVLDSTLTGIGCALSGGSMQMFLQNIENTSNSNPTAECLAGIIRFSNLRGFIVPTSVNVNVPNIGAAGNVQYVNVSMAGTRLADLAVGEGVVANPSTQLIAAGAGGGYINCRVQAVGVVECTFVGPLTAAVVPFNFNRSN
jgi:hypothetical protein